MIYIGHYKFKNTKQFGNILPLCLIGNRGMYLLVDGCLHPCSWTSFPFKKLGDERKKIKYEDSFFSKYRNDLNVKTFGLKEILNHELWNKLFETWEKDPWVECNTKCNIKNVDYDYAVGYETNYL